MSSSSGALSRLFRSSVSRSAAALSPSSAQRRPRPLPGPNPLRRPDGAAEEVAGAIFAELDLDVLVSRFKDASSFNRFRAKHRVYEDAVRRLATAGRLDGVAEILEEQKRYAADMAGEGFAARLISLYGIAGMASAAEETFRQLPSYGCRRTALAFNALLSACSAAGDLERMDNLFRSVPEETSDIIPNVVSYNILIAARCRSGDLAEAMNLLKSMQELGTEPNLVTFNTLLGGFYSHGRFSDAEKIWELMTQKSCQPDVKSFNAKVRGLVMAARTEEAAELVGNLPSLGLQPETSTFNYLIEGHCAGGKTADARKVFDEMRERGCRPNRKTFEAMVRRLSEEGELEEALSLCKESISRRCGVAAALLQEVAAALASCSRAVDAENLLKLSGLYPSDETRERMISSLAATKEEETERKR